MTDIGQRILDAPIPAKWKQEALPLFLSYHDFKRILAWHELYQQIVGIAGVGIEFGVGYGRDLNILACLRYWLEPHVPRRFVGFDSFEGVAEEDIRAIDGPKAEPSYYGFDDPQGFLDFLSRTLGHHCNVHPSNDKRPFDIKVGKVQDTLPTYLADNHEPIALAFFDMLTYEPTKFAMERIVERMPHGAVLAWNQINSPFWRGEAKALFDTLGYRLDLRQSSYHKAWYWGVL